MEKIPLKQRTIILVPFPFSDQSGQKVRPALILSNATFNQGTDIIACAITTQLNQRYGVELKQHDLEIGQLHDQCIIKCENIFKLDKSLIIKKIALITTSTFEKVIKNLQTLIKSD